MAVITFKASDDDVADGHVSTIMAVLVDAIKESIAI